MANEGDLPKSDGDILYASEVNRIADSVRQVYTGNGYDSASSTGTTDEQDHELTAVASTYLASATYVKITLLGDTDGTSGGGETVTVLVKVQIKETGGAYGDILGYRIAYKRNAAAIDADIPQLSVISTLTAGMKTNGFQIKVFSKCVSSAGTGVNGSYVNVQTIEEVI